MSTVRNDGWCAPWCTGLDSEPRAVGKRLGAILSALSGLTDIHVKGTLPSELREIRLDLHQKLIAAGWRVKATRSGWSVLPPARARWAR